MPRDRTQVNGRHKTIVVSEAQLAGQGATAKEAADPVEIFHLTVQITSAAGATAVNILPDAAVGPRRSVYVQGWLMRVNGGTTWVAGGVANLKLQDTSAVDFATVLVAALTANARVLPNSANVTIEDAHGLGTGGTVGKGLQVKGDANGTGSTVYVTVWGVIR